MQNIEVISGYGMYLSKVEFERMASADVPFESPSYPECVLLDPSELLAWNVAAVDEYGNTVDKGQPTGAFLFASHNGSIFASGRGTYESPDDFADEMRDEYGTYLPDDFEYVSHIAFMRGCRGMTSIA